MRGQHYPRTHDLSLLLHLLHQSGVDCSDHQHLVEYNAYAVQYRYEAFDSWDVPIDRPEALGRITVLLEIVEKLAGLARGRIE